MTTKDPFSTPVTNLKLRDWAALLPKPSTPRASASSAGGSVNAAADIIRLARQQKQLQTAAKQLGAATPSGPPQLPTWQQITAQDQGYEALPYSEKSKMYSEFLENSKSQLLAWDPKLNEFEVEDEIRSINPGPVKPERSWMELATDVGTGVAAGAVSLAALPVAVADAVSGEQSELGRTLEGAQASLRELQSPVVEDSRRQQAFETAELEADTEAGWLERRGREASIAVRNLNVATASELLPQLAGPGLVGLGTRVVARGVAGAVGAGAGAAARTGGAAGLAAASGSAGVLSAGDAASQARDAVRELTDSELRALPEYGEAMDEAGGDEKRAREALSQGAALIAAEIAGPLGVAFAAVPGSLESILTGGAARALTRGAINQGARASVIGGVDEALTSVAGNVGAASVIPDTDLFAGTGGDFALGALLEGGTGTVGAALQRRGAGEQAPTPPAPGTASPAAAPGATTTADVLTELGAGEVPGAAATAAPNVVELNVAAGGTTTVMEGPDGVWGYADADQVRDPSADEFIAAMNLAQTALPVDTAVEQEVDTADADFSAAMAHEEVIRMPEDVLRTLPEFEAALTEAAGDVEAARVAIADQAAAEVQQTAAPVAEPAAAPVAEAPLPATPTEQASFTASVPGLQADFATVDSLGATAPARVMAMQRVQAFVQSLSPATRVGIRSGAIEGVPPEVARAVVAMGLENRITDNPDTTWSVVATQPGVTDGGTVLSALAIDPNAGEVNQRVAASLGRAFRAAGLEIPSVSYSPTRQTYRGSYTTSNHRVSLNPTTTANTVVHEMMHGLTVKGLNSLEASARAGDALSANLLSLLEVLRTKLEASAGRRIYGTTNVAEMFAEMVRPEFMAVAMNTDLGTVPSSASFGDITGNPQAALRELGLAATSTVFDAIVEMVRAVIRTVGGGTNLPTGSIAEVLTQAATEVTNAAALSQRRAVIRARQEQLREDTRAQAETIAQVAERAAPARQIVLPDAELPAGLRRASPRFQGDAVRFANDIDKAAYIAANSAGRRSARDADYLRFVQDNTGWSDFQVRAYGDTIRNRVRQTPSRDGVRFVESQPVSTPLESGGAPATSADMSRPETVQGMTSFATRAAQEGLTRSSQLPSSNSPLGTLVSESASPAARQRHFNQALTQALQMNDANMQQNVVVRSDGSTVIQIRPPGQSTNLSPLATIFLNPGSDLVTIDSTGFESGTGRGGVFYDAVYGAIVAARLRAANGMLTEVNRRRMPINRLRNILKWGAIHGDFTSAANSLRPGTNSDIVGLPSAGSTARTANGIIGPIAARVAAQAEAFAPEPGPIRLTLDGRFTAGNGRVMTYQEMVDWARSAPINTVTTARNRAAASPDALAMAGFVRSLAEAPNDGARQAVVEAAMAANQRLFDTDVDAPGIFDEQPEPVAKASVPNPTGAPVAAAERNAVGQAEAESIVGDTDAAILSTREDFQSVLADAQTAAPAAPVSIIRGFRQGLLNRDSAAIKTALTQFFSEANEKFHDSLTPVNNWLNGIVNSSFASEVAVNRVRDAMYLAPGRRDHFMNLAMLNHGGRSMQQAIGKLAKASGKTEETIVKWVGYWLTAERAPVANRMLLDRATKAVTEAQTQLVREPGNATLQQALIAAVTELRQRVEAVNNPDVSVAEHAVNLAGGVSNAQAVALRNAVEANFTRAQIESVARHVYRLNAYRLALDIETGKTDPEVAGRFLQQPELVDRMKALREASEALTSVDPTSTETLNELRDEIADAVRSNYVPLTGDPTVGLDAELFPTGSAAPNVRADRAMQGRRSVPDDGVTASLGALSASTAFAGWRPFQEAIAGLYTEMTPDSRAAAGFGRRTLQDAQSGSVEGIVYRTNGRAMVYTVRDANVLNAIKKNNVDDVSNLMRFIGLPTKAFAYAATQLNPFFAPRNWLRDLWERSEIIRTRNLLLPDGTKANTQAIARRTWAYGMNPAVFIAAARFAAGRPNNGSRGYRALMELSERGGLTTFGDQFSRDRASFVRDIAKSVSVSGQAKRAIAQVVDVYNRLFDLVPVVSAYMAMQDSGMSGQDAAAASLDTMNFRKSGTAMPLARALYAFAQPAVTGGANIMSSLYNRRTGKINYRVGVPRLMGYTVSFLALQAMARSLADDDEGGNVLTQLSDWVVNNTFAFPIGDKIVTVPLAFGMPRIANGMAMAMLNVGSNEQTATEALGNFASGSVVPAFSPINDVSIDFNKRPGESLMATFSPTWLKPIVGLAINRTDFDAPIEDFRWEKTDQFRSEQYGENQAPFWKEAARTLRQTLGMDLSPNQVKHVVRGYALGLPGLVLSGAVDNPFNEARGKQVNDPITGWLVRNHSEYAIRSQFYRGLEETDALLRTRTADGSAELSEQDRRLLGLRSQWDAIDKELRKKTAAETRNKAKTEAAKDAAKASIRKTREAYQADFVRRLRTIKGQPVGRAE